MKRFTVLLMAGLCALSVARAEPSATGDAPQVLAKQVRAIFSAKCVECHGANLERPKGDFGYVLDLKQVAANPKMLTPGDADHSDIYLMVLHEEMPGPKSSSPPLTESEKETVKKWINAGAPPVVEEIKPVEKPLTMGQRIIRDLGQFHPLTVHFPIALLIVALPAEIMWGRTKQEFWKSVVRYCVALGSATALVAALLGWFVAAFATYTGNAAQVLEWHRWLGTVTGLWAIILWMLSEWSARPQASGRMTVLFRVWLVTGVLLVTVAGYLGASLIYGLNHFVW